MHSKLVIAAATSLFIAACSEHAGDDAGAAQQLTRASVREPARPSAAESPHLELFRIAVNDQWGFMDDGGRLIIDAQFKAMPERFFEGLAIVKDDSGRQAGFIDRTGRWVIPPRFAWAREFHEGRAVVGVEQGSGFGGWRVGAIDRTGRFAVEPQFDEMHPYSEGLARFRVGDQWGYVDKEGKIAINPTFPVSHSGSSWDRIDTGLGRAVFQERPSGIYVIDTDFRGARDFHQGRAVVRVPSGVGFIDQTGAWAIQPTYEDAADFSEGLAAVKTNGKMGYVDRTGNLVIPPQFDWAGDFVEGRAPVRIGDRMGLIDKSGRYLTGMQYSEVSHVRNGIASVRQGSLYGYIDASGKLIIPAKFVFARPFSENGLAAVKDGEFWGFIDRRGNYAIPPKLGHARDFDEGLAYVQVVAGGNDFRYINAQGEFVTPAPK